jgi:hypothetical protein
MGPSVSRVHYTLFLAADLWHFSSCGSSNDKLKRRYLARDKMRNFLRRVQDEKKRRVLLFAVLKFTSLSFSLWLSSGTEKRRRTRIFICEKYYTCSRGGKIKILSIRAPSPKNGCARILI